MNTKQKEKGGDYDDVDYISRLPYDVLTSIISKLPLKEATAASVLSSRFQNLHLCTTHLCIPPFVPKGDLLDDEYLQEVVDIHFSSYVKTINRIVDTYKGGHTLKEFRLRVPRLVGANLEDWLEFALSRPIETIDMDMYMFSFVSIPFCNYNFPLSSLIDQGPRLSLPGLKSLRELYLSSFEMDEVDFELLLSSFENLENLSISKCRGLKKVSVIGQSVLRKLDLSFTLDIQSVEIRDAINLVFLRCFRLWRLGDLQIVNVPKLVEFNTCGLEECFGENEPRMVSCNTLDGLQHLVLSTQPACVVLPPMGPTFSNLQHMELQVEMNMALGLTDESILINLVSLIEASPRLSKLDIKFLWSRLDYENQEEQEEEATEEEEEEIDWSNFWINDQNYNLKNVRLSGFSGSKFETQFASYITQKAARLDQLMVETCDTNREIKEWSRARAWQHFRSTTPSPLKLFIN